jgi:AraC-like DNA-binding protein
MSNGSPAAARTALQARKTSAEAADAAVRQFPGMGGKEAQFKSLWQEARIRPGVCVSILDASLTEDFSFQYQKRNRFIDFGFFLEGGFINNLRHTHLGSLNMENRAGQGGMGYLHEAGGTVTVPAGQNTRIIHVHVLPQTLQTMLGDDTALVCRELQRVLENRPRHDFFTKKKLSPKIQAVANELFFSTRNRTESRMYMEGKVLELLALQLMENLPGTPGRESALSPREQERIHAVRRYLEQNHAAPPSLADLAEKFAMSVTRMQTGFRAAYGFSVFGFLKEYRLQRAKMLFEEGDMNVSEVAWAIGYINLSHFSAAYRKRFGVLPKAYMQSIRACGRGPSASSR